MQAAEEDGHHGILGPLRQDQAPRLQGQANRKEEEDDGENCKFEPLLQRVLCLRCGRDVLEKGKFYEKNICWKPNFLWKPDEKNIVWKPD